MKYKKTVPGPGNYDFKDLKKHNYSFSFGLKTMSNFNEKY